GAADAGSSREQMTNDPPMTHQTKVECRSPNDEGRTPVPLRHWALVIRISLRHWWVIGGSFVICLSAATSGAADLPPGAARRVGDARFLHAGAVRAVAVSLDGSAVASTDGSAVYGWDAA